MANRCLLALLVFGCLVYFAQTYPLHASCKITWDFPSTSCDVFGSKIVAQAKEWESDANCANGGEKCLYKITSQTATEIQGTHSTPVKKYIDDLTFKMATSGSGCKVEANSRSETWYAYLDYGTNYCNLRNLMAGAGLNSTNGFAETTSDDVCTQYSSADCNKY